MENKQEEIMQEGAQAGGTAEAAPPAGQPKPAAKKRRAGNKSAAERKAQKAKTNAEKAAKAEADDIAAPEGSQAAEEKPAAKKPARTRKTAAKAAKPAADKAEKAAKTKAKAKPATKKTEEKPQQTGEEKPASAANGQENTAIAQKAQTTVTNDMPDMPKQTPAAPAEADSAAEAAAAPENAPDDKAKAGAAPENAPADKPEAGAGAGAEKPAKTPEELAAEARRAAELTRTVQVSIEQILARSAQQGEAEEQAAPHTDGDAAQEPEDDTHVTLTRRIGEAATSGISGLLKWLLLVLAFVAVIAGVGVAWLYRSATPDMLPHFTLTLDGQEIEPAAYSWDVPVVGDMFKRSYDETLRTEPVALEKNVESAAPEIELPHSDDYTAALTVADSDGKEIYSGTLEDFENFTFERNGSYIGGVTVESSQRSFAGETKVTGSQTYLFSFTVDIRPTVRLNTQSVTQGGVVSVRVTGLPEGEEPELVCRLENAGFVPATSGWVAYLPIPYDADTSESYDVTVKTESYTQSIGLTVRPRSNAYRDYTWQGALVSPYIALADTPEEVAEVLDIRDPQVYWTASGFVQPFIRSIEITLPYGTTEYVGRTVSQRANNSGTGRTSTNVVVTGRWGEELISPADGRVVLAEDLGGTAGNTVVVEHGAGLKSIFYNLNTIEVEEGDSVVQGQTIATTNKVTIGEVRIGEVPVEPLSVWRGQCDAIKNY